MHKQVVSFWFGKIKIEITVKWNELMVGLFYSVGYIEIYNEKVYDLLSQRKIVSLNQDGDNELKLSNKEVIVSNEDTMIKLLEEGNKRRKGGLTKMNNSSSRSHAIFRIVSSELCTMFWLLNLFLLQIIESQDRTDGNGEVQISYLNLVDLAGSEKAAEAGTTGIQLKEGGDINKSLMFLCLVIQDLSKGEKFIRYRSSKLTRILQNSLGGNSNTAIICNVTPAAVEETNSTLTWVFLLCKFSIAYWKVIFSFACQAKKIKTVAVCNKVYSEDVLYKQMQGEIAYLKDMLESRNTQRDNLLAEIAQKEATFLKATNMRPRGDRRRTWHHMPANDFQPPFLRYNYLLQFLICSW